MAPSPIVEGFSVSHAQILNGSQTFEQAAAAVAYADDWDIYGVNDASVNPDSDDYTNEGDDTELSIWYWIKGADLEVEAGYISFPLIANLTGQTVSSSGSNDNIVYGLDLWREDSFNVLPRPVLLRIPSRDHLGNPRSLLVGLNRVQFKPMMFDGPSYKDGLKISYNGRALLSATDEKGTVFADGVKRVGRLVSRAV